MRKSINVQMFVAAALMVGVVCLLPKGGSAQVMGVCSDCHTMHNSQDGKNVVATAQPALTKGDCIGCHSTSSLTGNGGTSKIPYVLHTAGVTYDAPTTPGDTLAGGDFYWVTTAGGTAAKGHNVSTIPGVTIDALGNTPPGGTALSGALTCAGTTGCHGDRTKAGDFTAISGSHHAKDTTIDGLTTGTSFRYLKGILGKKDPKWEYQATATAHNQYKGTTRTSDVAVPNTGTISSLCGQCHTNFHTGANNISSANNQSSPWVRHPTDFDMNTVKTKEYGGYNGTGNPYSVEAPVASTDVTAVKSAVLVAAGDAIVMCVSCHRAHGSPFDDLLRWDYKTMTTQGTTKRGCFVCHTTKGV